MPQVFLDIDIEEKRWLKSLPDVSEIAEKVKNAAIDHVLRNADVDVLKTNKPLIISVCLSSDEHVREFNRNFRNIDKPTNVLTFANMDFADFKAENEMFDEIDLGSIIVAYETMQKEADIENITLHAHFCHLLTHGILHILGFDHIKDEDAEYMEGFEKSILHNLGISDPYKEEN